MPTSTAEATALTWTTALLRAISSATAADPPTTLSRPIVAVSTISPEVRSTTMDTIPLWGKYRVLIVSPASNSTVLCGSSVTRRCGTSAAMFSDESEAHAIAVVRELSRNRLPRALVGRHISVTDERGVVVFKVPV
jgi:hypothetical protein